MGGADVAFLDLAGCCKTLAVCDSEEPQAVLSETKEESRSEKFPGYDALRSSSRMILRSVCSRVGWRWPFHVSPQHVVNHGPGSFPRKSARLRS